MHHNVLGYWQALQNLPDGHPDRPSPRVCRLLIEDFERWMSQPLWPAWDAFGHLFDGADEGERKRLAALPVAERKGLAVRRMLERISEPPIAADTQAFEIHPDELVVGHLPPYSVGQGKELMRYLTDEEALAGELQFLNEWSPFGHVVPDYPRVVGRGLEALVEECREKEGELDAQDPRASFYRSVVHALEGVIVFAERWAERAREVAGRFEEGDPRRQDMLAVAERLGQVPARPARTLIEAVQAIFLTHCALHWTGEITSLGRLDQILGPYYAADLEAGRLDRAGAQEVIDCFWLKLGEAAILSRRHIEDRFTSSDGALLGAGGASNFDQGALANQWMQQVTLGGVVANDAAEPEDASNEVTFLALEASRRLPLNTPTLDLRVHSESPPELLRAAARTLLSGGAHPILLNDDRIIPALHEGTGGSVDLASARNYACDGCFETLFAGQTEFSFGFVPAMDVLEKALNGGAGFSSSGGVNLRGAKSSWRSKPAREIGSFEELWSILEHHITLGCHRFLAGVLGAYGQKEPICPSVLLSAFIDGCLETGRDLAGGGARYHLFSPLMTGISTAVDSLFVIRRLVFERELLTLEELVACLRSNWGDNPEVVGLMLPAERIAAIRAEAMACPKFGHGVREVDELAWKLVESFTRIVGEVREDPIHAPAWARLRERYGAPGRPFEILLAPGVGTFEQYVFGGGFVGASADGRKAYAPIASDFSPAPLHPDQEPLVEPQLGAESEGERTRHAREVPILDALRSFADPVIDRLSDGAPADLNIREDFPEDELVAVIEEFAAGRGGNALTVTVADPETLAAAQEDPGAHELVRVRMGGWTEFFITLFPAHQAQHRRRPLFVPGGGAGRGKASAGEQETGGAR